MNNKTRNIVLTGKLIVVILLVAIVGLQFVPYLYGGETATLTEVIDQAKYLEVKEELANTPDVDWNSRSLYKPVEISIAKYVWLSNSGLKNDQIWMPVLVLFIAILSIATYVKNTYSVMTSVAGIIAPLIGLAGFLTMPVYKLGAHIINPWVWYVSVALCAITALIAIANGLLWLISTIIAIRKETAARKSA